MTNQQKFDRLRKLLDEASVYARAVGKLEFYFSSLRSAHLVGGVSTMVLL